MSKGGYKIIDQGPSILGYPPNTPSGNAQVAKVNGAGK